MDVHIDVRFRLSCLTVLFPVRVLRRSVRGRRCHLRVVLCGNLGGKDSISYVSNNVFQSGLTYVCSCRNCQQPQQPVENKHLHLLQFSIFKSCPLVGVSRGSFSPRRFTPATCRPLTPPTNTLECRQFVLCLRWIQWHRSHHCDDGTPLARYNSYPTL